MNEPRGHKDMFGAILVEPVNKQCDLGVIFMDSGDYLNLCGHGTIDTVTICINTGRFPKKENVTVDTPSGIIECKVHYNGYQVDSVEFTNVPAFTLYKDLVLDVPSLGEVTLDIAFGVSFFAIVNAATLDLEIHLDQKQQLLYKAKLIRDYINENVKIEHPTSKAITTVDLV